LLTLDRPAQFAQRYAPTRPAEQESIDGR